MFSINSPASGGRVGWRRTLALSVLAAASLVVADDPAVHAQILAQQVQNSDGAIPRGSPTGRRDQQSDDSERPSQNEAYIPPVIGDRYMPTQIEDEQRSSSSNQRERTVYLEQNPRLKKPPEPNEFEKFVERALGRELPRFGIDLLLPGNRDYAVPATSTVPPGYQLNPGDTISIGIAGSIEGSIEREIDTNGRIFLPRVGWIRLGGVRYADAKETIARAIGTKFRNFTVNVSVRELRGVRVYVTGFANNPGAYSVGSLSTLVNAVLAAGGPSAGGSFRSVKLYRNNQLVSDFDLYRMLLAGDRTGDAVLQNEDVLFIAPLGEQVAVTGSVNTEAIFEVKAGETLEQILSFSGGTNSLADSSRLLLYRLSNYDTIGAQEVTRGAAVSTSANGGDIIQVLSDGTLQRSIERQSVVVRIEGEVNRPGSYYLPANTPLSEVLAKAGGLTARAFVYGTRFERSSVRRQQRESFDEAIQQLEITLAAAPLTADQSADVATRTAQEAGSRAVLERLRKAEPDGRVVLGLPLEANTLPGDLVLENNDRFVIPPRPTTIGVFGAVYRPASFVLGEGRPLRVVDYVERAGGTIRAADRRNIFVVRASGDVVSSRRGALRARVQPGDVVFVPVKTQSTSVWAKIRDISTVLFQFGITAATVAAVSQ